MIHALLIGSVTFAARAGNEVIRDFRLRSCAADACVMVESPEARRSPLDPAYVFESARVSVLVKGLLAQTFNVPSGYYEPNLGYLIMHGRGLINLASGKVTLVSAP